jgi:hypothetical protein
MGAHTRAHTHTHTEALNFTPTGRCARTHTCPGLDSAPAPPRPREGHAWLPIATRPFSRGRWRSRSPRGRLRWPRQPGRASGIHCSGRDSCGKLEAPASPPPVARAAARPLYIFLVEVGAHQDRQRGALLLGRVACPGKSRDRRALALVEPRRARAKFGGGARVVTRTECPSEPAPSLKWGHPNCVRCIPPPPSSDQESFAGGGRVPTHASTRATRASPAALSYLILSRGLRLSPHPHPVYHTCASPKTPQIRLRYGKCKNILRPDTPQIR